MAWTLSAPEHVVKKNERTPISRHDTDFRSFREALLVGEPASSQRGGFWETYCVNRGGQVRSFRDQYAAMQWLLAA